MLEISKSGKTQYGVWVAGKLTLDKQIISGIFSTNLEEVPTAKIVSIKALYIRQARDGSFKLAVSI